LTREKTGVEFPFTRYFYEYHAPEKSDALLKRFMELERSVAVKIKGLGGV
jgi:type I restriction enzyme M protein